MKAMSRRPHFRSLLLVFAACAALAAGAYGFSGAASLESALEGTLAPSSAPSLLGPITESGRKGWECKPEQAAAASHAAGGELPAADDHR
jgi:hypothetical protein